VVACGRSAAGRRRRYDLVVSRDLDYEVFTSGTPSIAAGFRVLAELAEHPRVRTARFRNALDTPDQGLYWQLRCTDDLDQEWKVDLWALATDHPGPLSASLVEPMRQTLNDELRSAVLLKEARAAGSTRGRCINRPLSSCHRRWSAHGGRTGPLPRPGV
jgi:hypothetical protein